MHANLMFEGSQCCKRCRRNGSAYLALRQPKTCCVCSHVFVWRQHEIYLATRALQLFVVAPAWGSSTLDCSAVLPLRSPISILQDVKPLSFTYALHCCCRCNNIVNPPQKHVTAEDSTLRGQSEVSGLQWLRKHHNTVCLNVSHFKSIYERALSRCSLLVPRFPFCL